MNRIQIANRVREQLDKFLGIFSPSFSKPDLKFIGQMVYGLQAHQDVKLSQIARALNRIFFCLFDASCLFAVDNAFFIFHM